MTEESSAEEDEGDADDELAPARSEEEPDVEAAKAELEAVGSADEDEESESATPEEPAGEPVADEGAAAEAGAETDAEADVAEADEEEKDEGKEDEEEANPEDLVRDPDEPQVTSTLDAETDDEAATPDADGAVEGDSPEATAQAVVDGPDTEQDGEHADTGQDGEAADPDAADAPSETTESAEDADTADETTADSDHQPGVPEDVRKYDRFKKVDGSQYDRVNEFLRDRTYITAREWAIARLCSDFRTETGVEMTKIGENLPELVPFMTDTYTPQAVNQARSSFEDKVRTAGATFLYGAMCDFFTAEELDDVMYEATEVAKFLLEVEGVELSVEDELEAEDRISAVMREVRSSSAELRHERCPDCGAELSGGDT